MMDAVFCDLKQLAHIQTYFKKIHMNRATTLAELEIAASAPKKEGYDLQSALDSREHLHSTGLHITQGEFSAWVKEIQKDPRTPLPTCHK